MPCRLSSKFSIIKKTEDLSTNSLILACKIIFSEYGPPNKIMSDTGGNFMPDKFEKFHKKVKVECTTSSSYHHQSNGQAKACIKLMKRMLKKCHNINSDAHIALLQISTMPVGPGLSSPVMLLINCPTMGIMPIVNRLLINLNNDDEHNEALVKRQTKMILSMILLEIILLFP